MSTIKSVVSAPRYLIPFILGNIDIWGEIEGVITVCGWANTAPAAVTWTLLYVLHCLELEFQLKFLQGAALSI